MGSIIWEENSSGRALLGEHYFSGEHFEESTIFPLMNLFLTGIAPDATVDRGRTEWLIFFERLEMSFIFYIKKNGCILRFWSKSVGMIGWAIIYRMSREDKIYTFFFISILHGWFINDVTVLRAVGCIISDSHIVACWGSEFWKRKSLVFTNKLKQLPELFIVKGV